MIEAVVDSERAVHGESEVGVHVREGYACRVDSHAEPESTQGASGYGGVDVVVQQPRVASDGPPDQGERERNSEHRSAIGRGGYM